MTDTAAAPGAEAPETTFISIRALVQHAIRELRGYADSMRYTYEAPARAEEMHALADTLRDDLDLLVPAPRLLPLPHGELRLANGVRLHPFKGVINTQPGTMQMGHTWVTKQGLGIIATYDLTERFGNMLHVSISRRTRNPTWEEIKLVRALFFPDDVDVCMILPKTEDYVNVHSFTFHLQQTPTEWGMR